MNLKITTLLLAGLIITVTVTAQSSINYQPKALVRTLQKAGISNLSTIKEISLPDSILKQHSINGKFFQIDSKIVSQFKYIYVGRVNSCRAGGCSISHKVTNEPNSEYFDYYILFDQNKVVQLIQVFNYRATHGQEITAKAWLKQFIGYNGKELLQVDKNIDAISGATISVYAITRNVETITEELRRY